MKKCVLVTGSRGLIGSRFCEQYGNSYELISGDVLDGFDLLNPSTFDTVIADRTLDAIVHLAAFTDVSAAYAQQDDESGLCYQLNVTATENVLQLAAKHSAHLVHISTDFVFDGKTNAPISESEIPSPIEWYGKTKWLAEQLVEKTDSWTIMRIAFPFVKEQGARPDLVANITSKLRAGDALYLFNDQIITPTFADDIVDAISRLIDVKPTKEIFHVMGPDSMSPYDLGVAVADCLGLSNEKINSSSLVEFLQKDPRPRQQYMAMDTSKYRAFCAANGFSEPVSIQQALKA